MVTKLGKLVSGHRSIAFGAHRLPASRTLHAIARRFAEPWGAHRTCRRPLGCGAAYLTRLHKPDPRRDYCPRCRRRLFPS